MNNAARMIFKARKHQHISPLLMKLHWLPVTARITYKIATLAYKHFEGTLPEYLSSSLHTYTPARSLRSGQERLLVLPPISDARTKSFGERSFNYQAPIIWNSLPHPFEMHPHLLPSNQTWKLISSSSHMMFKLVHMCVCECMFVWLCVVVCVFVSRCMWACVWVWTAPLTGPLTQTGVDNSHTTEHS